MPSYFIRLVALAAAIAPIFAAPAFPIGLLGAADLTKVLNPDATDVIEDSYIVVYKPELDASTITSHVTEVSSLLFRRDLLSAIRATYDMDHLKGYQITADIAAIAAIAASPLVAYIEKDTKVYPSGLTSQNGAPWGLGRISHRNRDSTTYIRDSSEGSGITVYVVDTGIYTSHSQFGGRASFGANYISGSPDTDENGHGTHCSGTIAGSTYGVAKKADLVAVKVLDKDGSGSTSGVISGIRWVGKHAKPRSVLSMSLGGGYSLAINSAVKSTIGKGVTVVVAAGNDNEDASNSSPASEETAITVGAIDADDNRAYFSNYGGVVDIFAAGVNILSSWIGSTTATNTISGTSMAAPHIAGLAAYLMALEGISSPAAVQSRIKSLATNGKVVNAQSANNLIGYNGNDA